MQFHCANVNIVIDVILLFITHKQIVILMESFISFCAIFNVCVIASLLFTLYIKLYSTMQEIITFNKCLGKTSIISVLLTKTFMHNGDIVCDLNEITSQKGMT